MCLTCGNKDKLICSHVAKDTCTECERDEIFMEGYDCK